MTVFSGTRGQSPPNWGSTELIVEDGRGPGLWPRAYHCFEWGYGGTGPGDLARFILEQHTGERPTRDLWMAFKFAVVAELPRDAPWSLTSADVQAWLDEGALPCTFPKLGNTAGIGHGRIRVRRESQRDVEAAWSWHMGPGR